MKSKHRLQLAQNAAARVVKRTPKREHMTPVLRDLYWLPIIKRVQFKILLFVFKALHCQARFILFISLIKLIQQQSSFEISKYKITYENNNIWKTVDGYYVRVTLELSSR